VYNLYGSAYRLPPREFFIAGTVKTAIRRLVNADFSAHVYFHAQEVEPSFELHLSFTSTLKGDHVQPQMSGRSIAKLGN